MGAKLVDIPTADGKLTLQLVAGRLVGLGDEHRVQPLVVSITQATELGTVYSRAEVAQLAEFCHDKGLLLHMDGARIANAAASLGCDLRALTAEAGVDVISFGGTKNGLMGGEAVVFLDPELARDYLFVRKQSMQLNSKMRFVSAQLLALLDDDLWLRNAEHANAMARRLADAVAGVPGVEVVHAVQANAVFARLPREAIAPLQERYPFYVWDEDDDVVRWMCSWDTREPDVDAFAASVRELTQL
jgi:threonine aldolase